MGRWKGNSQRRKELYVQQNGFCFYCGHHTVLDFSAYNIDKLFTIDHKIPRSKGGTNRKENLVGACHRCNQTKQSMAYESFMPLAMRKQTKQTRVKQNRQAFCVFTHLPKHLAKFGKSLRFHLANIPIIEVNTHGIV